ncbi:hypothetical protein F5Y13DRAFT_200661 [Hypoxylon sp. FL1857]|nr:hypothetical protein F5Y13DRAFT_200661 [Hypoxylon sp. FL1857]
MKKLRKLFHQKKAKNGKRTEKVAIHTQAQEVASRPPSVASQSAHDSISPQSVTCTQDAPPIKLDLWLEARHQVEDDPKWKDSAKEYADALSSIRETNDHGAHINAVDAITGPLEILKKENEANTWIIPLLGGKKVAFHNVLSKIAENVKFFATLGVSLAELDPTHGAKAAFGLLKIFAQVVIDGEDTRKLVADQEPIIHIVSHYAVVEQFYLHTEEPEDRLQKGLVQLYVEVLHYQIRVYQYYREGIMKHTIQSFTPSELKTLIDEIEKKKKAVDNLIQEAMTRRSEEDRKRLKTILLQLETPVIRIGSQLNQWRMEDSRKEILRWVSNSLPEGRNTIFDKARPLNGTCQWLITDLAYKNWREGPKSGVFWLKGKMGSGKTHLVTAVIEDIRSRISDEDIEPVLFYYCDHANINIEANAAVIINSILRQMLAEGPELPVSLINKHSEQQERRDDLYVGDAVKIFTEVARGYARTYIIIDGTDELNERDCDKLFDHLQEIASQSNSGRTHNLLKIFISSRTNISHIERNIDSLREQINATCIDIDSLNQSDIELFVEKRLIETLGGLTFTNQIEAEEKANIRRQLCSEAKGMFRWVELSIEYLSQSKTRKTLFNRLKTIPDGLNELYETMYQELARCESELLIITLRLLMYAQGNKVRKTVPFLSIIENEFEERVNKETILDVCRSLVEWNEVNDEFGLAHLSVKEFLERKPDFEAKCCHDYIAQFLLRQLIHPDFPREEKTPKWQRVRTMWEETSQHGNQEFSLERYAVAHWIDHCVSSKGAKDAGPDRLSPDLVNVLLQFCDPKSRSSSNGLYRWLQTIVCSGVNPSGRSAHFHHMKHVVFGGYNSLCSADLLTNRYGFLTLFYLACQQGLQDIVDYYLDSNLMRLEQRTWRGMTGITFACIGNQWGVVNNLISRGALEVNVYQDSMLPPDLAAFLWSDMKLFIRIMEEKERHQTASSFISKKKTSLDTSYVLKILEISSDFEELNPGYFLSDLNHPSIYSKLLFLMRAMTWHDAENTVRFLLLRALKHRSEDLITELCDRLRSEYNWRLSSDHVCLVLTSSCGPTSLRSIVIRKLVRDRDIEAMMAELLQKADIVSNREIILDLFCRKRILTISDGMMKTLVMRGESLLEMIQDLFERRPDFSISSKTMDAAIRHSKELARELLRHATEYEVSEANLRLGLRIYCHTSGDFLESEIYQNHHFIAVLVESMDHQETISESTVFEALRSRDEQIIQKVLKRWPDAPTSRRCLTQTLYNPEYVRLILHNNPSLRHAVDSKLICSTLRGSYSTTQTIELLRIFCKLRDGPLITDRVLIYALGNKAAPKVIKVLLKYQNPKVIPTEDVVKAACGSTPDALRAILESRPKLAITEAALIAACDHEGMLEVLSEKEKDKDVVVTDEVMLAAVWNLHSRKPFQALLKWQAGAEITERVLFGIINAARCNTCWRDASAGGDFDELWKEIDGGKIKITGQEVSKDDWRRQFYGPQTTQLPTMNVKAGSGRHDPCVAAFTATSIFQKPVRIMLK